MVALWDAFMLFQKILEKKCAIVLQKKEFYKFVRFSSYTQQWDEKTKNILYLTYTFTYCPFTPFTLQIHPLPLPTVLPSRILPFSSRIRSSHQSFSRHPRGHHRPCLATNHCEFFFIVFYLYGLTSVLPIPIDNPYRPYGFGNPYRLYELAIRIGYTDCNSM